MGVIPTRVKCRVAADAAQAAAAWGSGRCIDCSTLAPMNLSDQNLRRHAREIGVGRTCIILPSPHELHRNERT